MPVEPTTDRSCAVPQSRTCNGPGGSVALWRGQEAQASANGGPTEAGGERELLKTYVIRRHGGNIGYGTAT